MTGSLLVGLVQRASEFDRRGDWQGADQAYTAIFREAVSARAVPEMVAGLRQQARVRSQLGLVEEAEELALLSCEIAGRSQLQSAAARAMNVLAFLAHSGGDLRRAEELYHAVLERARELADSELIAAVCQNLGVLANLRGDLREARTLYLESVGSIVRADDRSTAMVAYNNLGIVCSDLGEWLEAEIYFGRGIEIAEQLGAKSMLVKLHGNSAEPLIQAGEFERARAALALTEALAREVGDGRGQSDAHRYRARMARIEGAHGAAEKHLEMAIAIAEEHDLDLERGEHGHHPPPPRRAESRLGAARVIASEALRVYESLGADRDSARVRRFLNVIGEEQRQRAVADEVEGPDERPDPR
jgi:tetratricopeptide (TPR) repeat protein